MTSELQVSALRALASGDAGPLGDLYRQHAGRLMATGLRMLGNVREAEDLLHDVFLEAWQKAGAYDPARGTVSTWLLVRMRSRALDRRKALAREGRFSRGTWPWSAERSTADPAQGPDLAVLREAVANLPGALRTVVELTYFADLPATEIARRLGVPTGTVKSRLAASRRTLRGALHATGTRSRRRNDPD